MSETVSLVGDQFYLVALPWLVIQTTGSSLAVGTVTAAAAIPRALLMLFAGALTDRLSARTLMLWSSLARLLLAAGLALLTFNGAVELWMLYGFAFAFGFGDAFYFPARGSLVPRLVPSESLLMGNAIVEATGQFAMFAGPVLAGSMIAVLARPSGSGDGGELAGLGLAFAVDAFTFLASAVLLWCMRTGHGDVGRGASGVGRDTWRLLVEGLAVAKADPFIRSTFLLVGAGNFLISGPLYVGLPVLADTRFAGGAGDLGLVLSVFGAGSLTGVALAALGRHSSDRPPTATLFLCPFVLGAGLVLLGATHTAAAAAVVTAIMGLAQGFLVVQFITFLQARTPPENLGRVIGLLTFVVVGLSPLSSAFAGALLELSVSRLLIGAGAALMVVVFGALVTPGVRSAFRSPPRIST
jgi:MFS family permease